MGEFSLETLEPREVLRWFAALAEIPRGSGNTKGVSDFCVRFARERGLEVHRDGANNVVIIAPAAPGYEAAPPLVLQGHLDMVCAKEPGCGKDMAAEGIDLAVDGDWLYAEGTTLGADDGAAVAMILAALDDRELPHPRLEAVLTADEETGMFGMEALDVAPLQGRTVLNLDSESEGVFTVSCAGGARAALRCALPTTPAEGVLFELEIGGLTGGHSGAEIDRGRANANLLLGRALRALCGERPALIRAAPGGEADNAIPSRCRAAVLVPAAQADGFPSAVGELEAAFRSEFAETDGALRFTAARGAARTERAVTEEGTRRFAGALAAAPNGVRAMSAAIPGLVETSLNLGTLTLEDGCAVLRWSLRSSAADGKRELADALRAFAAADGAAVEFSGDYPAWTYRASSPLRERMVCIFRAQYGREPVISAIHAGLECGILAAKIPDMDCVSIGPDLEKVHTPGERMSISSLGRVWTFVRELLKESR